MSFKQFLEADLNEAVDKYYDFSNIFIETLNATAKKLYGFEFNIKAVKVIEADVVNNRFNVQIGGSKAVIVKVESEITNKKDTFTVDIGSTEMKVKGLELSTKDATSISKELLSQLSKK